eukprot:jgi/Chlat1/7347/Chrsp59S06975
MTLTWRMMTIGGGGGGGKVGASLFCREGVVVTTRTTDGRRRQQRGRGLALFCCLAFSLGCLCLYATCCLQPQPHKASLQPIAGKLRYNAQVKTHSHMSADTRTLKHVYHDTYQPGVPGLASVLSASLSSSSARMGEAKAAKDAFAPGNVEKAEAAPTIFDKIVKREIPATIVYEDDKVLAFRDINPQAPTHIILIPKERDGLTQLAKAEERHKSTLGHLLYTAKTIAQQEGLDNGYRVVVNDGPDGCQSVLHLHLHILGGRQMQWPPG